MQSKYENATLEFKWTVSRGRDTYGYNICSLYVDGTKVSVCDGGGYDMEGTVLGNWVAYVFKDELLKLEIPMSRRNGADVQEYYGLTFHDPNFDVGKVAIDGETIEKRESEGKSTGLERYQAFYRESSNVPTERHTVPQIDGGCGFGSVETIIKALGYGLRRVPTRSKNSNIYVFYARVKEEAR